MSIWPIMWRRAASAPISTTGSTPSRRSCRRCANARTSRRSWRICSRRRQPRDGDRGAGARIASRRRLAWPGNIRELRNLLTRATLTQEAGTPRSGEPRRPASAGRPPPAATGPAEGPDNRAHRDCSHRESRRQPERHRAAAGRVAKHGLSRARAARSSPEPGLIDLDERRGQGLQNKIRMLDGRMAKAAGSSGYCRECPMR